MKIYTVKDKENKLYPKTILELPNVSEAVRDGKIVEVDYGLETVLSYIEKDKSGEMSLAICELIEG